MWPLILIVLAASPASPSVTRVKKVLALTAGCVNGSSELHARKRVARLDALEALRRSLTPQTAAEIERTVLVQNEAGARTDWAACFWDGARTSRLPFHDGERLRELLDAGVVRIGDEYVLALNRMSDPRLVSMARAYERRLDAGAH